MFNKNENIILFIIKYTPPVFILTLSFIISLILYFNNQATFNEEKTLIQKQYIEENKKEIKSQVNITYKYIIKQQKQTEKKLKKSLKERVYEAHTIATNIYEENKHLDKNIVKKMIKDALRNIRFNNGRGYFFIYSFDYECILLPVAKQLEGSDFYNFKEGKGNFLTRDIIKMVKEKDEGFMTWWYHKPNDMKNQYKKLGFNKHFKPFDWFIGTGEYFEDFEGDIKKDVLNHIHNTSYEQNGYIFVLDYEGNYLNHIRKEIIGLNALKAKDTQTHKTVVDAINTAKNGEGYISYIQNKKPGNDLPVEKTSYVKGINNWQWLIGKGFYKDDLENIVKNQELLLNKRFKNNMQDLLIMTIILTVLLLVMSIYISKILENRFRKYQDEIKINLEEITKQHNILAHQSKMAAIGTMIGNIAHQWRQPLSLISTAATGMKLKKEINDLSDEEFNSNLDYINDSTQYLSKTIDDFRNFFATNKEKVEFSIDSAFNEAINLVNVQFVNNNIQVINKIQNHSTYGIQSELVQVLINILNNSRDELLNVEEQERYIFIESFEKKDRVVLEIKDNAGGIKPEIIEHIFEPYFTTKHQSQGTGIGLYMSQEIIVKHFEGSMRMENTTYSYNDKVYTGAKTIIEIILPR
ncbi:cache domain-containing protein [Arcobacter sp. LA11]|uniref:sensor histidine kinase n=1 Tax=Arcobacter sp. LA11 TaxID=1898176 RepID=UPI000932FA55|nr:cache domain-containing protein [Arcobacter sp. LA11]